MRVSTYRAGGYGDSGLSLNGGNISGVLILAGNPSQPLEAVPKQYADNKYNSLNASNFTSGILNSARLPAFNGDLISTEGSNVLTLSETGVIPGSYGKVTVNSKGRITAGGDLTDSDIPASLSWNKIVTGKPTTLIGYGITDCVSNTGGVLNDFLTLIGNPVNIYDIVPKQYVDSLIASNGLVTGDIIRKTNILTTPAGFLRCNGGLVDKVTYANLYAIIGDTFTNFTTSGSGKPWKQQYQINTTQSDDIIAWTTDTLLPDNLSSSQAIVTKNRVYLLGGNVSNGVSTNIVYTASINSDGTLGSWVTGTSLPISLHAGQTIVTKNRVYLLGGYSTTNGGVQSAVYTAPINTDGTLGAWTTDISLLPGPLLSSQAIVTKNRVYLLGGSVTSNTSTNTVYTAPINADGTLGSWTTSVPLPSPVCLSQAIVTKNRVYLLGGHDGTSAISTIYTAPINTDGTLGAWTTDISLPNAVHGHQAIVTKNRVYLLGGNNGTSTISTVYTAPINTDGTLGTWAVGSSLPSGISNFQAIVTKNRVYLLGGWNGSAPVSTVYTAPISGGLNDYSPYYDGTIVPVDTTTKFALPDTSSSDLYGSNSFIKY